ncbi:MAG: alpha/beta fold hydrolase [Actinobacteria bacterium]|nr:alpha/beta fold hydrolase [Actinomycetota bacterium]
MRRPRRVLLAGISGVLLLAACSTDATVRSTTARPIGDPPVTSDTDEPTDPTDPTTPGTDDTAPDTTDGTTPAGTIDWGPCDDEVATDPILECGSLTVPLDPQNPGGDTIDIAMVRVPAADPDDRVGAVLFNPGGPGGSGFDYVAQAGTTMVSEMGLEDFDVIGFDPRGVDRSNGLRCLADAEIDASMYLDYTPDTPEEQAAVDAVDGQFEEACLAAFGDTLIHYSTVNTAYDMDAIRAALGDEQISFIGISYGTYLGSMYATLFPDRVRAMVLDAAFEPTGDTIEQQYTTQAQGFDDAFENWVEWCQTNESCAFRSDDVTAAWDALRLQLDATPAPASDGRLANETVLDTATNSALYSESQWPLLASALQSASAGDGDELFILADSYNGRNPDGTYATISQSFQIITCASGIDAEVPDDPQALVDQLLAIAPRYAQGISVDDFTDSCALLMPNVEPIELSYPGDAPILVVGGLNDPATPFRWAEEMTVAMGSNARLLTYTGEGHGQMLNSTCVTEWEGRVITDLELPPEGEVCDPDPPVAKPGYWDTLPVPEGVSDPIDASAVNGVLGITPTLAYSESRTTALSPAEALDAYDAALEELGFVVADRVESIPGVPQGVYFTDEGTVFSILAIAGDAYDSPDLGGLADVVDRTQTLLVLLAFSV